MTFNIITIPAVPSDWGATPATPLSRVSCRLSHDNIAIFSIIYLVGVQIAWRSHAIHHKSRRNQPVRFHDGWLLINERHLRINDLLHRVAEGRVSKTSILPAVHSICMVVFRSSYIWIMVGICEWPTRIIFVHCLCLCLSLELIASQLVSTAVLVFTGHLTTINLVD